MTPLNNSRGCKSWNLAVKLSMDEVFSLLWARMRWHSLGFSFENEVRCWVIWKMTVSVGKKMGLKFFFMKKHCSSFWIRKLIFLIQFCLYELLKAFHENSKVLKPIFAIFYKKFFWKLFEISSRFFRNFFTESYAESWKLSRFFNVEWKNFWNE